MKRKFSMYENISTETIQWNIHKAEIVLLMDMYRNKFSEVRKFVFVLDFVKREHVLSVIVWLFVTLK